MTQFIPAKKKREIKEDDLQLEPLCTEVIYFTVLNFVHVFFKTMDVIALWVRYCSWEKSVAFAQYRILFHTSVCMILLQEIKVSFLFKGLTPTPPC